MGITLVHFVACVYSERMYRSGDTHQDSIPSTFPTRPSVTLHQPYSIQTPLFQSPYQYMEMNTGLDQPILNTQPQQLPHQYIGMNATSSGPAQPAHNMRSSYSSVNTGFNQHRPFATLPFFVQTLHSTQQPLIHHHHSLPNPSQLQHHSPYQDRSIVFPQGPNTYSPPTGPGPPVLMPGQPVNTFGECMEFNAIRFLVY